MSNNHNGIEQQIFDQIGKTRRILIALPQSLNGDALGSGLALHAFLRKLEKEGELVSASASDAARLRFLPGIETLRPAPAAAPSFVVRVNTATAPLDELSYEHREGAVEIFLKPKTGSYAPADVSFKTAKFPYDLIITLDAPSLENLGPVYERNRDLFFETPLVNIDHHPNNENYGQFNLVDLTASSTAEILASLMEQFEEQLLDEAMATNLLAGIIYETNSFQNAKTTPRAFLRASALVAAGARQQDIIRELYKTKGVGLLKLWGRALARIKEVPELGLAYSLLSAADLEKSGGTQGDLLPVMREFAANLAGRRIVMLLCETAPREHIGYFYLHPSIRAQIVAASFGGAMLNGSFGSFRLGNTELAAAETEILGKLRQIKNQIVAPHSSEKG